jgi:5-methylcytosine-specific restriction endonuclease McrA
MKNIHYLNTVEIDEFNLIKASKHTGTRARIDLIIDQVEDSYDQYLNNFQNIHNIGPSTFTVSDGNDLRSFYKIKTIARDNLLKRIIDNQTVHFKHTCPYCLLNIRSTYDHYVPEEKYPVFCVLVKNLIPCCTICNGKKLEFWRINGGRGILHFYIDIIPQIQFLFGTLTFSVTNIPFISYNLTQTPPISNNLYSIIEHHFSRLELIDRYQKSLDLLISDIIDDVEINRIEFGNAVTQQTISNLITLKASRLRTYYGRNYWKSIALDLLANSPQFISSL